VAPLVHIWDTVVVPLFSPKPKKRSIKLKNPVTPKLIFERPQIMETKPAQQTNTDNQWGPDPLLEETRLSTRLYHTNNMFF
jgi:hypothetical protein